MKSRFVKGLLTAFMVMTTVLLSSCERIDAGCEGTKSESETITHLR